MSNWDGYFQPRDSQPKPAVWVTENLKRCPLCGAVNAATNDECFVCRWHGEFERDAEAIEIGLSELAEQCPELDQAISESEWIPLSQSERIRSFLRKIFWPTD